MNNMEKAFREAQKHSLTTPPPDYKSLYEREVKHNKHLSTLLNRSDYRCDELLEDIDGDGWLKEGYKTELSNSHKMIKRMSKQITELREENKQLKKVLLQSHKKNI
jgi:hypothetical protein